MDTYPRNSLSIEKLFSVHAEIVSLRIAFLSTNLLNKTALVRQASRAFLFLNLSPGFLLESYRICTSSGSCDFEPGGVTWFVCGARQWSM